MELLGGKKAPRRELCYSQQESTRLDEIKNFHDQVQVGPVATQFSACGNACTTRHAP